MFLQHWPTTTTPSTTHNILMITQVSWFWYNQVDLVSLINKLLTLKMIFIILYIKYNTFDSFNKLHLLLIVWSDQLVISDNVTTWIMTNISSFYTQPGAASIIHNYVTILITTFWAGIKILQELSWSAVISQSQSE